LVVGLELEDGLPAFPAHRFLLQVTALFYSSVLLLGAKLNFVILAIFHFFAATSVTVGFEEDDDRIGGGVKVT
jgi:hypothetical protein